MGSPNLLIVVIDDLRFDEYGAGGHPYMKTPNIDRIGREGATCVNAFHTTPLCSPNRASILTGQYASRHGIIDNVARDAESFRLNNYHLALRSAGYETAHIGKWHMGNSAAPRPGYDRWVAFPGHGEIENPILNIDGDQRRHEGYVTDLLNHHALEFVKRKRDRPFALYLAHKAVHPDAVQRDDGKNDFTQQGGYKLPARHEDLYRDMVFTRRPNALPIDQVVRQKPALREMFELREGDELVQRMLKANHFGTQEEIRRRAAMMASVDEGLGNIFDVLEATRQLDNTCVAFVSDNGFFFGEHGLSLERRLPYEEAIRSPLLMRYPSRIPAGSRVQSIVLAVDIAPTMLDLAGIDQIDPNIQGRSIMGLIEGGATDWRTSFMAEYHSELAMPWVIGMTYKAIRTERFKYIHWVNKNPKRSEVLDELYDLKEDPYEVRNVISSPAYADVRTRLVRELSGYVAHGVGLQ